MVTAQISRRAHVVACALVAAAASATVSDAAPRLTVEADRIGCEPVHALLSSDPSGLSSRVTAARPPRGASGHPYGWPLKPFGRQHPIRAYFDDPRMGKHGSRAFHFGVDISAPDGTAVYAVEEGTVYRSGALNVAVVSRDRSHAFSFWHIVPVVAHKQFVHRHQLLGHIHTGSGHVHFAESWGTRFVNPLRAGALTPYADHVAPTVASVFVAGDAGIDIVAEAFDIPAMRVPGAWTTLPVTPALVQWRAVRDGRAEPGWRTAADFRYRMLDKQLFSQIYADGTVQNREGEPGHYCFRIASHWRPADGSYRLQVRASDTFDNSAQLELAIEVAGGKVVG